MPTPALDEKPEIRADLRMVGEMYLALRRSPAVNARPLHLPIPNGEIVEWADLHGSTSEAQRLETVNLMLACDRAWRTWALEQLERRRTIGGEEVDGCNPADAD
jgi:hypothetical protein